MSPSGSRGAPAFVVLEALAFRARSEPKDAHDLFYALRYSRGGVESIARALARLRPRPEIEDALAVLRDDFASIEHVGPMRVGEFLGERESLEVRADVVAFVRALLSSL